MRTYLTYNRTILELKLVIPVLQPQHTLTYNRTILELKHEIALCPL